MHVQSNYFLFVTKIFYFAVIMKIGEAIRTVRVNIGLTQEEVCRRARLTQGFYCNIENGVSMPSIDTLQRICNALELPVFFLIWQATSRSELSKKERVWHDNLNPVIQGLIAELTTTK